MRKLMKYKIEYCYNISLEPFLHKKYTWYFSIYIYIYGEFQVRMDSYVRRWDKIDHAFIWSIQTLDYVIFQSQLRSLKFFDYPWWSKCVQKTK